MIETNHHPTLPHQRVLPRLINLVIVICCVAYVAITLCVIFSVSTVECGQYSAAHYRGALYMTG